MEKLKAKHDHKLTDILKVAIFGIFLILPFIVYAPNAFYYGFNEHAVVGQEETTKNFYQGVKNGKPTNVEPNDYIENWNVGNAGSFNLSNGTLDIITPPNDDNTLSLDIEFSINEDDIIYFKWDYYFSNPNDLDSFYISLNGNDQYNLSFDETNIKNSTYETVDVNDICNILQIYYYTIDEMTFKLSNIQIFNLTQIFGSGNEPTKEVFESYLTKDYYNFGNNNVITEKGTNITWNMYNGWEDIWQTPMFNWTNESVLKQGLDNFTGAFGVSDTSYFTNLIVYELIMVAIYIVIDIVLTLLKWLTHMVGSKE